MAAELYITGMPCKRGHIDYRFKSTGNCCECNRLRSRKSELTEAEHEAKKQRERDWYAANQPHARARNNEAVARFAAANPAKIAAWTRASQAAKLQRIPPWADLKKIQEFYEACPDGYEVDHVIPLQGKTVSGFHIFENLQYLTVEDNRRKGNRYP